MWHGALLPSYGLPEILCKLIASFLTGRSKKVAVDKFSSEHMLVNAGVPQACVLSPTLLILHINDKLEDSSIHCYADDSTVDGVTPAAQLSRSNVVFDAPK